MDMITMYLVYLACCESTGENIIKLHFQFSGTIIRSLISNSVCEVNQSKSTDTTGFCAP